MLQLKLFLLVMAVFALLYVRYRNKWADSSRYNMDNDFTRIRTRDGKHPRDIAGVPKNTEAFSAYVGDSESNQSMFMPDNSILNKENREQYLRDTKIWPQSETEWLVNRERSRRSWE